MKNSLSCLTAVLSLCVVAALLANAGSVPTCINETHKEIATHTVTEGKADPQHNVNVTCYRDDWCCFSCLYDATKNVTDFHLKMHGKDGRIFNCERKSGPPDSSTFTFDEKQQELCLKGLVNESGRYKCKMEYEADLPNAVTVTDVTIADKLGTTTVTVENTDPVKEAKTSGTVPSDVQKQDYSSYVSPGGVIGIVICVLVLVVVLVFPSGLYCEYKWKWWEKFFSRKRYQGVQLWHENINKEGQLQDIDLRLS